MDDIYTQINEEVKKIYEKIIDKCEEILRQEIFKTIYKRYTPKKYTRTRQLLDTITTFQFIDDSLFLTWDTSQMNYISVKGNTKGQDVSKFVPYWVNYGHRHRKEKIQWFDIYPGNNKQEARFLEKTVRRIKTELGLDAEIIIL